jgi:glycosidase
VDIIFGNSTTQQIAKWPLLNRRAGKGENFAQGVTSKDVMYLLMPDRFSNGDKSNDRIAGMLDQSINRDTVYERHGGDLQGVINHLDYLKDLGVTSVWMTPIWENDMPNRTEHGYAITNHYKVDPRLGTNKTYESLGNELHKRGMKLVQDVVYNHVGLEHFFYKDKPMASWFHNWDSFTQTTYKDQTLFDPYASAADVKKMSDGWFVTQMPDLNHANPFVEKFLIQHALWTVETFGVDGWRIDTYAYNDLEFMNRCNKALYDEYPKMSIFGETWVHGVINQSFFAENNLNIPFKSNLQNTTDFQTLFYGIQPALTEKFGWTEGVNKLYTTAAQDIVYKNPMGQVIFLDNHDIARFYSVVGEDTAKYKMALSWLLNFRGIPQMYYGMEHLMTGFTNPDGNVRRDFLGGWESDAVNKFRAEGRTAKENAIFNHIKTLANFRKNSSAITEGQMMQYLPVDGLYIYFRYDANQTIACIMNTAEQLKKVDIARDCKERTQGFSAAVNVLTGQRTALQFDVEPMSMLVLKLD